MEVGDLVKNKHWKEAYSCPKYGLVFAVEANIARVWWDRYRRGWSHTQWYEQSTLEVISESR